MKTIAVLLTVYNRRDCTLRCLDLLRDLIIPSDIRTDIYITDGGSTDGTVEAIKTRYPEVTIQVIDGVFWNRGMYASWNAASRFQKYDYYLWLNDDTFVYPQMITKLISTSADKNDKSIIVGPTQSLDHKNHTYGGRETRSSLAPVCGEVRKVITFNGNIVLVPQFVYSVLGNLDYYYQHSWGDLDYGFRAGENGIEIYQVGEYLGECNRHDRLSNWCNPSIPLKKRLFELKKPTQYNPSEMFYFEKKHFGFCQACFHYMTLYLRCLFPSIWVKMGKAKI